MVYVDGYFPCYVSTDPHARAPPKPLYAASWLGLALGLGLGLGLELGFGFGLGLGLGL